MPYHWPRGLVFSRRPANTESMRSQPSPRAKPVWVAVGALALATLAGVSVIVAENQSPEQFITTVTSPGSSSQQRRDAAAAPLDLPVGQAAPAIRASGWLNSAPLSPADLREKVVLYDIWTFGCSNCRATQPYVKAWHERYAKDGLIVLSIHTPEFDYERPPEAVAEYARDNGLNYPIALDPDSRVWNDFNNRFWPAFYLHDRQGKRRLTHFGEGSYANTENAIRQLLGVVPGSPRAAGS